MAKLSIKVASTSQTVNIFIQDSSSTTGAGKTGLVFNSSGLTAYYGLSRAASAAITLATLAATTSAYSSGGFKEIDSTNMPGWYRFDIPDAALASGRFVAIHLQGVTNMAPLPLEIELTGFDNQSTTDGNLSKLTSLTFTGANKVDASVRDWVGDTIPARNVTGVPLVDAKYLLGTVFATPATAGIIDVNVKNMNNVAATAITTIKAVQGLATDGVVPTVTNLTNAPTAGDLTATMKTSVVTAVGTTLTCTEPTAAVAAAPTLIAAISWLLSMSRNKITQTATTQILKADDGSTTIATSTVSDDATTATRGEFA